ncbi:MAG: radical SAM protein [Paludibacteraceae bacterium]|nr:radical SAM protein [Paludibacteraceae bacterium]
MQPRIPFLPTPLRIGNWLRNRMSFYASVLLGKPVYRGLPYCASVEPVNFCNLHCPHCPTGRGNTGKTPHRLGWDDYRLLLERLSPTLIHLNLFFQGEPTLHPLLPQMVALAREKGVYTCVSTNGQTLDRAMAQALADAGLNKLIIDLDGADEESYQAYRQGGSLQAACRAVREAVAAGLTVEVQCLLLATTEHQKKAVRRLARSLGARHITFKTAQLYDDRLAPSDGPDSRYRHTADGLVRKKPLRPRCARLWRSVVVNTYGQVLPCCFDKQGQYVWGNLLQESLYQIVYSKAASGFRQAVMTRRASIPICGNCCE